MAKKPLSQQEIAAARAVFKNTLPYDRVIILSGLGLQNRQFTVPSAHPNRYYNLNLGPSYLMSDVIHELVHVWQSYNSGSALGYAIDSLLNQVCYGFQRAYAYEVGKKWSEYNVEQQASIVEGWYMDGQSQSDSRFRYIRDSIWHPEKREGFSKQDMSGILQ